MWINTIDYKTHYVKVWWYIFCWRRSLEDQRTEIRCVLVSRSVKEC